MFPSKVWPYSQPHGFQELDRKLATCVSCCLHGLHWRLHRTQSAPSTDTVKDFWFFLSAPSPPLRGADSSFVQHSIWLTVDPEPEAEDWNSRTRSPSLCFFCDVVCVKCLVTAMRVTENAPITRGLLPHCYIYNNYEASSGFHSPKGPVPQASSFCS